MVLSTGCDNSVPKIPQSDNKAIYQNSKPYTRYWWFASEIKKEDIRYNLDWLLQYRFDGVTA